jgi:polysaccharide export outer membrane protein
MYFYRTGILVAFIFLVCSCNSNKQLTYFQDLNDTSHIQRIEMYPYKPILIQVDDQLQISITSTSPEAVMYFNQAPSAGTAAALPSYTVFQNGSITMPVLGDIYVQGLSTEQIRDKIARLLLPYLKDAVVSVKLVNFKVTVIGEVGSTKTIAVPGEHMNALEAIGAAGDMTPYGIRDNIKVVRKNQDTLTVAHLNFKTSNAFKSPFFQLRQNDVIYVEPNKIKGFTTGSAPVLISLVSSLVSLVLVLYVTFRNN